MNASNWTRLTPMLVLAAACFGCAQTTPAPGPEPDRPLFELDGETFVVFYDLPSRRFGPIRQAIAKGDLAAARQDLSATVTYLRIETQRARPELARALEDSATRLEEIVSSFERGTASLAELDTAFARIHWRLAQHFLLSGVESRNQNRLQMAGRYLIASAHHMERAVLRAKGTVSDDLVDALEGLRAMGVRLQGTAPARYALENRPMVRAARTLTRIGREIDRPVVEALQAEAARDA